MGYPWPKKNKFSAIRTNGMGSKLEAAVYQILLNREKAGQISDIKQQVTVILGTEKFESIRSKKIKTRNFCWKVDFCFYDIELKQTVYAEAKGIETSRYRKCLNLWRTGNGPGFLEVWKGSYHRPKMVDRYSPNWF